MKNLIILLALTTIISSCGCDSNSGSVIVNPSPSVVVTPQTTNLGDNLNLQALGELVKNSNSAQEIESKLNQPNSINNLDLDGDGKVDYIKVTEYNNSGVRGFSFTVDMPSGQSQEVASVELQQGQNNQATMNINGNQTLYGNNGYYSSNYLLTDLLIWHYMFYPHSYYMSPYRYGYYPSYYHPYGACSYNSYYGRVRPMVSTSRITRTTTTTRVVSHSPNTKLSSPSVSQRAKSMSSPTRSQRSFSTTTNSRPSTSGFRSSGSSHSSGGSRSYGGGHSSSSHSFGSSSHSSGGGRRSDKRFKLDIRPLSGSLDRVCSLSGVTYQWNTKSFPNEHFEAKQQIGLIAQDVERAYPQVVNTRPDGYKTIDYDLLVPALIESIKELRAKSDKQDSIINVLTKQKAIN